MYLDKPQLRHEPLVSAIFTFHLISSLRSSRRARCSSRRARCRFAARRRTIPSCLVQEQTCEPRYRRCHGPTHPSQLSRPKFDPIAVRSSLIPHPNFHPILTPPAPVTGTSYFRRGAVGARPSEASRTFVSATCSQLWNVD